jgi:hypothetical protein
MKPSRSPAAARRGRTGFTIAELLLGLSLFALVGLGVAMMLASLSSSTSDQHDLRQRMVTRQTSTLRLGSMIRSAAAVLDADSSQLVLWKGDADENLQVNLSEIRLVKWNPIAKSIVVIESPATLEDSLDESFDLESDFLAVANAHAGLESFAQSTLLDHVDGCGFTFDAPLVRDAELIRVDLSLDVEGQGESMSIVTALRAEGDAS